MPPHRNRRCVLRVEQLEERATPAIIPVNPANAAAAAASAAVSAARDTLFGSQPILPTFDATLTARVRSLFRLGQLLGNRPDAFIKVGDSNTASGVFLASTPDTRLDRRASALLGSFGHLAPTIEFFRRPIDSAGFNSFTRASRAAQGGGTTFTALANLNIELATVRPSIAFIMLGTNDLSFSTPTQFQANLRAIVQRLTAQGVIPVLSTIPDNFISGGTSQSRVPTFNQIIANVARENGVPLVNLWSALQSLPHRGLSADRIHPSSHPSSSSLFTAEGLQYGFNMRNLITLHALDAIRQAVAPLL